MNDPINPQHYTQGSIEFIDAMEIVLTPEEFRGFLKGNAIKYLWREKKKQGIEDLQKAKWYLDRLVNHDQLAEVAGAIPDLPVVRKTEELPKQYREPTLADLASGPIDCEVRDYPDDEWLAGTLSHVHDSPDFGFFAKTSILGIKKNWPQCRIEVTE